MKFLTVFNICKNSADSKDNCDSYITSINSIINQNLDNKTPIDLGINKLENKLVVSAVRNTQPCLSRLQNEFKGMLDLVYYEDPWTVNITFNKTVREMVKNYGQFDAYIYIDSGCILNDPEVIRTFASYFKSGNYSMISIQTDSDNGFLDWLGFTSVNGQDFIMPVGRTCNLHCQLFSNDLFMIYGQRVIPDVFAAYATESVFSFLNSSIHKKWIIPKDIVVQHRHGLDGGSIYFAKISPKYGNDWNNFLFDRNALDMINDPESINAGLGYEEYHGIFIHRGDMHENDVYSRDPIRLRTVISKYLFLRNDELNYDAIRYTFNNYLNK